MMTNYVRDIQGSLIILGISIVTVGIALGADGYEPAAHRQESCASCHATGAFVSSDGLRAESCTRCHGKATSFATAHSSLGGGQHTKSCLQCHQFHSPQTVNIGSYAAEAVDLQSAQCRACHDPRGELRSLSDGHRAAAVLYHQKTAEIGSQSPSETCLKCHAAGSDSSWLAKTDGGMVFHTMASHPYGVAVEPGEAVYSTRIRATLDPRLPLFDGRMECATCHLLTAETKDLLIPFENPYDLCLGCHQVGSDPIPPDPVMAAISHR